MPIYRVCLKREVEQEATMTVEAASQDEAEILALSSRPLWRDTGFIAGPWTSESEEEEGP